MPATLDENIAAYDGISDQLESEHLWKWVVFHDAELVGSYSDFQDAAVEAVKRFGRGPYLIRQVGAPPRRLPSSILYRRLHADH